MPGPMMIRGAMAPPTEADIDQVVEAQGASVDKVVEMNTPMGRYSEGRLKTLRDVLQAALDVLGAGAVLPEAFPIPKGSGVIPMPKPLVEALLTIRSAYDAWAGSMGEEGPEMVISSPADLTDDSTIALALPPLKRLAADKAFKKWAKTAQPPVETATPPTPKAPARAGAGLNPDMAADLATLFGS